MRPHRLRVTAFGAFGGTVEVSFDDLASSGLFLLHGETGAGKTTLLDAIGFALYGRVPGERGKARRLLGWQPAPAQHGLARSVGWHLANPPDDASPDFTDDDRALAAAAQA